MGKYSDQIRQNIESGFAGHVPTESVFTEEMTAEQKKPAKWSTMVAAGIPDDPITKIAIYAAARFPNDPEAVKRYGMHKGRVMYMGDDGKLYPETPDTWFANLKKFGAETMAHSPSILLGTLMSAFGPAGAGTGAALGEGLRKSAAKFGYDEPQTTFENVADIGTEFATGYGGDVAGRLFARGINRAGAARGGKLAKEAGRLRGRIDIPKSERIRRTAKQYGLDVPAPVTTGSGTLAEKYNFLGDLDVTGDLIKGNRLKLMGQIDTAVRGPFADIISKFNKSPLQIAKTLVDSAKKAVMRPVKVRQAKSAPIYKKAFTTTEVIDTDKLALELSRNQATIENLEGFTPKPDIEAMEQALKAKRVPTGREFKEGIGAYEKRITADYKRIIKKDAPTTGEKIDIKKINELKKRNTDIESILAGKPTKLTNIPLKKIKINTKPAIDEIDSLMAVTVQGDPSYQALSKIKKMIKDGSGDLQKLDRVKRSGIDNILNKTGTTKTLKREMKLVKDKLLLSMDKAVPDYKRARKIFSEYSEEVDKQQIKTLIGEISKLEGDQQALIMNKIFESPVMKTKSGHEIMKRLRTQIREYSPDAWEAGVRDYLLQNFDRYATPATDDIANIGGMFRKKVFGSPHQQKILKAALDPKQYKAIENFMEVMERTGLIMRKESRTASRLELGQRIKKEGVSSKIIRAKTMPLYTKWRIIGDFARKLLMARGRDKTLMRLADALLNEDAAIQLEKMVQLPPSAEKLIPRVTTFLTLTVRGGFSEDEGDIPIDVLKAPSQGRLMQPTN